MPLDELFEARKRKQVEQRKKGPAKRASTANRCPNGHPAWNLYIKQEDGKTITGCKVCDQNNKKDTTCEGS